MSFKFDCLLKIWFSQHCTKVLKMYSEQYHFCCKVQDNTGDEAYGIK